MSARIPSLLLASASFLAAASATPSFAQTAAQSEVTSGSGLEEIVVTARRREERLQAVPLAITAFTQADIEQKRIMQLSDLGRAVPSLAITLSQSDANAPFAGQVRLRGLPGSVVYFADVPLGSVDSSATNGVSHANSTGFYFDLDNLEVLKGPQGTLFGKNSIGGLISIEPKKPTNEFEGYVQATFGNYNDREFQGAINIPIVTDKLLVRIAGQSQQRDGYTDDYFTGKDYDNRNFYSWRIGVTFRPTDDFENYLLYDGYWQDSNGSAPILSYANPDHILASLNSSFQSIPPAAGPCFATVTLGGPAFAPGAPPGGCGAFRVGLVPGLSAGLAQQLALGPRTVLGRETSGIGKDYFYGFTDTATWNITDDLEIKNIASARVYKQLSSDADTGFLPILDIGDPVNNHGWNENSVSYTEEFQIQGKALADKLSWVVGGFLEFDHPIGDTNLPSTAVGTTTYSHFYDSERSQAAFVHGIYDLSDYVSGLRFTAGYRYTWDYVSVQEHATNNTDTITRDASGAPTNCQTTTFDTNCASGSNAHFSSYGWNLSLDEQLTPDTLIYVRSGNAYRPGGTNPSAPLQYQALKPEHVTDVEIGAKVDWSLFGAHLRTNGDVFHTDYKAIQVSQLVQVIDSTGVSHAISLEANAASATLEGAEFEATVIPVEGVEISPHVSYLYSHYDEYPTVFGGSSDKPPFFYEPKFQFGVTGTYHLPVDASWGDIALSATYSFTGQQYIASASAGEIYNIIPSYDQLDLRIDWTGVYGLPVDASFFMTNVLDDTHVVGAIPVFAALGFTSLTYNEPRMFGFSLKYRFGPGKEAAEEATAYTPPPAMLPEPATPKSYLVFFDFNKSDLTPQAATIVDQAAKNVGSAKVTKLEVTGHTDTVGSDAYNMRLSRRRAESVAALLEKDGVPAGEIAIFAKGKRDLLVPTADGVKEPQNRRVQIVYSGAAAS